MPWFVNDDTSALKKSAAAPGPRWTLIPGATDAMSQDQAEQQLVQDAASGKLGSSLSNGVQKLVNDATGGAVSSFQDVSHALSGFFAVLTDGKMWRSLGWLLLGVILMFTGIGLIIGPSAARRSPLGVAAGFARKAYG